MITKLTYRLAVQRETLPTDEYKLNKGDELKEVQLG